MLHERFGKLSAYPKWTVAGNNGLLQPEHEKRGMMANPELSQRIQALPEELLDLEREPGTAERLRRIDALKDRARALEPLDGVEDMALEDYDRDWLVRYTWTRKISCYLCCFFGGCHWLPRRMKYQERPYNRTPLHSREAGREQTKTPQHIPFRLFYSQVPFQMHFKVPKKRHTYRSDRFCRINCHALSFLHRGGFVSRRCICSFNGDDARAPWPCNPPRIGRPCRR